MVGSRGAFEKGVRMFHFQPKIICLPLRSIINIQTIPCRVVAQPGGAGAGAGGAPDGADMPVEALVRSVKLTLVLWWLGGNPRLLARFLTEAAERLPAGSRTWADLRAYLSSMSMGAALEILTKVADEVYEDACLGTAWDAMLSLAVSERHIRRDLALGSLSVAAAEAKEYLYWQEVHDGSELGVVRIPPLLLLAKLGAGSFAANVIQCVVGNVVHLDHGEPIAAPLANCREAMVAAALLHKYRAAQICGASSTGMTLPELGFPADVKDDHPARDLRVQVPERMPKLKWPAAAAPSRGIGTGTGIAGCNIVASLLCVRPAPTWEVCASSATAAVVDPVKMGHLRITVHVQVPTAPPSCVPVPAGGRSSAAPHVRVADVAAEYRKVAPAMAADAERGVTSLFLFVADKPPPPTPLPPELRDAYVVVAPRMMGALLTTLNTFAPLWPALLGASPAACVEFGNRPAPDDLVAAAGLALQPPEVEEPADGDDWDW